MRSSWLILLFVAALALPAAFLRATHPHLPIGVETTIFGLGILSVAFLLTWTAEAAEHDLSQGIAIALLALIAVLPEYAVDIHFALSQQADFATANMTGANRLLIGIGWALVIILFWVRTKRRSFRLSGRRFQELAFLTIATAWSFTIPLRDNLSMLDTAVLVSLFAAYVYMARGSDEEEVELVEPAKSIGDLPTAKRRSLLVVLFLYSAGMILLVAEPFAEGLVHSGQNAGIDEFLLVQWVAPLASEAPEIIIASILVLRGRTAVAMAALISSKVNQWTLLIGTLPAAYAIGGGSFEPMPLDSRQVEEVFLTSAQSIFAIVILANLRMSVWEGALLFVLFASQLALSRVDDDFRMLFAYGYLVLAFVWAVIQRTEVIEVIRTRGAVESSMEPAFGAPPEHSG